MESTKINFLEELKEGYEKAKKPIAFILMFLALLFQSIPAELMPQKWRSVSYTVLLIILALILMEILFVIYDKAKEDSKSLNIIKSNKIYDSILAITNKERVVTIKYIGIAGRNGWDSVLAKLIDENNEESLIANRTKFKLDVALLNPKSQKENSNIYDRFDGVESFSKRIMESRDFLLKEKVDGSINLFHYNHMPNMLGFLVNENYLFVTYAFWEQMRGKLTLRGGGTDYFVYDKNDDFGGQEIIRRFKGWFDYIKGSNLDEESSFDLEELSDF